MSFPISWEQNKTKQGPRCKDHGENQVPTLVAELGQFGTHKAVNRVIAGNNDMVIKYRAKLKQLCCWGVKIGSMNAKNCCFS